MNYYQDITLLPSDDIGMHFLWSKVMMQLHLALVEIQDANQKAPVASSFPNYREAAQNKPAYVGNKIRLFATNKTDLERLNIQKWMNRLEDYLHIKSISEVDPSKVQGYESFSRRHKPGNVEYMIRRRMNGLDKSYEEATEHFKGYKLSEDFKRLPFIQMKSLVKNREFRLVIKRKTLEQAVETDFVFNTYGLNKDVALPKF
ncbi:type I-F CRISPR-associated endoribonuclease Cas6/Csy4 [Marinomonas balearica]|uniref:CRISPR-associated Csy4 family protein n=1 Tax=Marinomonas balearica TaxID=491947 RepID=A0A4R6M4P8_9GAMM|nr:type I-F CRISPR-associated endoribonuclease Cas6/Csy4 [Marinomonas balearica]TDO96273.1 CRISPR-associated Csy4 family protein [Marinomonas balearica]